MAELEEFRRQAHQGRCLSCNNFTYVVAWSDDIHMQIGKTIDLCFICSNVGGVLLAAQAPGIPQVLGAISVLVDTLKPPRKPRTAKQPKAMMRRAR